MTLILYNIKKLEEIRSLMELLQVDLYIKPKHVLSGATIGQHIRHILEFYICLKKGVKSGTVSYDERERNILIETDMDYARVAIGSVIEFLSLLKEDQSLALKANYSDTSEEQSIIQTSIYRELAYSLDHTVHHLAIVKIALLNEDDKFDLDDSFGVAPSTLRYRQQSVQ